MFERRILIGTFTALVTLAPSLVAEDASRERPLVFGINRVANRWVLHQPPEYPEDVYRRIAEVGGTCVRLAASPRDIERVRGERDWSEFDRDLELAIKYKQEPVVLIVNTPAWASPTGKDTHQYPYKTELFPEFADFCTELAVRTKGKIRYFQLWNEQNGCSWHFHDGWNHADEYVPFLNVCYHALKKGNPDCIVSLGSLDDAEGHAPIFMRKTYEEMEKQGIEPPIFEAVSDHPYSDNSQVMREKLDALHEIMAANGDADMPLWITEYGWQIGDRKPDEQARKYAEVLKAFISPEFDDLEMAISLSLADFEGGKGFGVMDANLRPRPAYYAFQAAERFGAFPPYEIAPTFAAANRLVVAWKTLEPTVGEVELMSQGKPIRRATSPVGKEHEVAFGDLVTGSVVEFRIQTEVRKTKKTYTTPVYTIHVPDRQVLNGTFDGGFFGGIARTWTIEGDDYCTDASLIPAVRIPHDARKDELPTLTDDNHAQAVFERGQGENEKLDSTLHTLIATEPDETIRVSMRITRRRIESGADVSARWGFEHNPGVEVDPSGIQWSDWREVPPTWQTVTLEDTARGDLVRLVIQCKGEGKVRKRGLLAFLIDDVKVER